MIKSALKLLAVVVIGVLIYNYFMGTPEEKSNSKKIFKEFKDVGVAVKGLLKSEKEKFDSGKYDKAIDKIGDVLDGMKRNAKDFDEKYLDKISELDLKRKELRQDMDDYRQDEMRRSTGKDNFVPKSNKDSLELKRSLQDLLRDTEKLLEDMDSKN